MVYLFKSGSEVRPNFHNHEGVIKQCNTLFRRYLTVYLVFISCLADFFTIAKATKTQQFPHLGTVATGRLLRI